jgi:hypothetical protein
VSTAPASSGPPRKLAVEPEYAAEEQPAVAPRRPIRQVALITGAPVTRTVTASTGTSQPGPYAFQYSSSWSPNAVVAAATVYEITYVCRPVIVRPGSPMRTVVSATVLVICVCAGASGEVTAIPETG